MKAPRFRSGRKANMFSASEIENCVVVPAAGAPIVPPIVRNGRRGRTSRRDPSYRVPGAGRDQVNRELLVHRAVEQSEHDVEHDLSIHAVGVER